MDKWSRFNKDRHQTVLLRTKEGIECVCVCVCVFSYNYKSSFKWNSRVRCCCYHLQLHTLTHARTHSLTHAHTKLGRIHSNLFEYRFFEFEIINSNFEFGRIWLIELIRPNSTVEFEELNLNLKNFTIYRPKMHKIHPFWSKKVNFD